MEAYLEQTADAPKVKTKRLRIDFVHPWKGFPYNVEVRSVIITHLIQALEGGSYSEQHILSRYWTVEIIGDTLDVHMAYLRSQYRYYMKPEEVRQQIHYKRLGQMSLVSRKNWVCIVCGLTLPPMLILSLKLRDNRIKILNILGLNEHLKLFENMENAHMSDDEPDEDHNGDRSFPSRFHSYRPDWRSAELGTFLHTIDTHTPVLWGRPKGRRATPGNPPRQRYEMENMVRPGEVPVGLWKNCYDAAWLSRQRPHIVRNLEIIDSDYDLDTACLIFTDSDS